MFRASLEDAAGADPVYAFRAFRVAVVGAFALLAWPPPPTVVARTPPQVSIWYRGTPAGTPRQDDLAMIRAIGFSRITWPETYAKNAEELFRHAAAVTLAVDVRAARPPLTPVSATSPGEIVDVPVSSAAVPLLPALVWRAVGHGARSIAFDPGHTSGPGVAEASGETPPWVFPARAIARQLAANAGLFDQLGVPVVVPLEPANPAVEVLLFQTSGEWIIVATNLSTTSVAAAARFPRAVPYAPWAGLLDGSQMAMRDEPLGPRWTVTLEAGAARVYLTKKRTENGGAALQSRPH